MGRLLICSSCIELFFLIFFLVGGGGNLNETRHMVHLSSLCMPIFNNQ